MTRVLIAFAALAWIGACNNDQGPTRVKDGSTSDGGPVDCDDLNSPPPTCGDTCTTDLDCGAGTFCNNRECAAACTDDDPCPAGKRCTSRGRCEDIPSDAGPGDAGDGASCIDDEVTPTRIIPNIMFLVDRSGSMRAAIDGSGGPPAGESRWEIARTAILTVVGGVEDIVRFGATTYHNTDANPACPELGVNVDFGLNNASTIATEYPSDPTVAQEDTPTGDAVTVLIGQIRADPPPAEGPTILVLATDGEPDRCEDPDGHDEVSRQEVVDAVTDAFSPPVNDPPFESIQTFVLSVGDDVGEDHLQKVANVGIGLPVDESTNPAEFWVGTSPEELEAHFREIITDQISCEVELNGVVEDFDRVCEGDVQLNGMDIACVHGMSCTPGPDSNCDGWRIKDGTDDTLELLGQACQDWKEGAEPLTAVFPCGIIIVE